MRTNREFYVVDLVFWWTPELAQVTSFYHKKVSLHIHACFTEQPIYFRFNPYYMYPEIKSRPIYSSSKDLFRIIIIYFASIHPSSEKKPKPWNPSAKLKTLLFFIKRASLRCFYETMYTFIQHISFCVLFIFGHEEEMNEKLFYLSCFSNEEIQTGPPSSLDILYCYILGFYAKWCCCGFRVCQEHENANILALDLQARIYYVPFLCVELKSMPRRCYLL